MDSVIAQDIYKALTDEGYRVFFSRISLEGKLGAEFEPYIFAALNGAKVMIIVGTDYVRLALSVLKSIVEKSLGILR